MASIYAIPVVSRASGPQSYYFVVSMAHSQDGKSMMALFGVLFRTSNSWEKGFLVASVMDHAGIWAAMESQCEDFVSCGHSKSRFAEERMSKHEEKTVDWE